MEIRHLRYFCVLAEQLHFTKAALLLNVAQPALSHQIKQLEEELGARLVERTNRRVRLTAAGEIFLSRALLILEQVDQAMRDTTRAGQGEAGNLIIGVVSTAVCSVLPELLRRLRREAPRISIDIREMEPAEQVDALRREAIDIGLLFLSIQDPEFDSVVVSKERLIMALPTGHPAAAEKVRLSDLEAETFLIPRRQNVMGFHEVVLETLRAGGIPSPRLQPTRLLQTAVFLAAGRLGVAVVPESFRRHLRVRGCMYRDIAGKPAYADLIGLWRRSSVTPVLRRFIRQLKRTQNHAG
ncbi:MAG: LysR family transcriptional regulator [Bryobacterales bacterium]|nr:LysR family transcriptional regulator [Bryobacterales bacterium]MBV9400271.1 LysR family transcriptional regulator [Bryobacterales bacterium]